MVDEATRELGRQIVDEVIRLQSENRRLRKHFTKINRLIFANGAPVGSKAYFEIRQIAAQLGEVLPEDPYFNDARYKEDAPPDDATLS
ncbi:hypothetical protein [Bradyrhizobium elkanii]|uniref:hypothetical protein n=1 Tax=Bradyrhizobium elkanii TaxID=29448 RepID=UPI00216A89E9|nr:hypothetical protein [Bradyrhizobium elkanii]MCS3690986.1 hypothetical protein [Bradyrhizobium elkanii]